MNLERMPILVLLSLRIHEHGTFLHLFRFSFIYFSKVLQFSEDRSCTSFVRFIPCHLRITTVLTSFPTFVFYLFYLIYCTFSNANKILKRSNESGPPLCLFSMLERKESVQHFTNQYDFDCRILVDAFYQIEVFIRFLICQGFHHEWKVR